MKRSKWMRVGLSVILPLLLVLQFVAPLPAAASTPGIPWSWGQNSSGQLGDGTTTNHNTPVQVTGLTDVTAIASGDYHSLALKSDGTVWAWGRNTSGQLGDGTTTTQRNTPVQVSGLTDVTAIASGGYHSLALKSPMAPSGHGAIITSGNSAIVLPSTA